MTRNGIWANEACPIAWWLNNEPTNQTARQREHVECTRTTKPFNRQRRCCLVLSITSVRISSASPFAFFALFSLHYSDIKAKRKNFSFSFVKYWNRAQFVRMFAALFRHIFICISFFFFVFRSSSSSRERIVAAVHVDNGKQKGGKICRLRPQRCANSTVASRQLMDERCREVKLTQGHFISFLWLLLASSEFEFCKYKMANTMKKETEIKSVFGRETGAHFFDLISILMVDTNL